MILLRVDKERVREVIGKVLEDKLSYQNSEVAAILFPLMIDDGLKLVMIMRSKNLKRSAGHIAFPGGIREGDETPVETAIRETEEELGIQASKIEILGYLSPKEVMELKIKIHPVVGIFDRTKIVPDDYEVKKVLIDDFLKVLKTRRIADWGPNYECDGELVWGASSRILDDFYLRIIRTFGSIDDFEKSLF
ncbi:MAG: CoA pyrophosphatase [Archaeoglobus sp.]|nr:CoA pyrophosphatase [Archaeoglobus sp.]